MTIDSLTIDSLWDIYISDRSNVDIRNRLIDYYYPLVRKAARKIRKKILYRFDLDELVNCGIFGLIDALSSYDPDRGQSFEVFSIRRIYGSIIDEIRRYDPVPRDARKNERAISIAYQEIKSGLGHEPNDLDFCNYLSISRIEYEVMRVDHGKVCAFASATNIDLIDDKYLVHNVEEVDQRILVSELVKRITAGLSSRSRIVLLSYYFLYQTQKEIGESLNLSEGSVSLIRNNLLKNIRSKLWYKREDLYDYL